MKLKKKEYEIWFNKLKPVVEKSHKRNIDKIVHRLLKKSETVKYSMYQRSKKNGVKCDITVDELRELILEYYGKPCKYDKNRIINIKNMVFDHIIPMSKGGETTKSNIQIISKFSNNVKGSLIEKDLFILIKWLDTLEPELKKDISIRLAHGIR